MDKIEIEISQSIKDDPELRERVERANEFLRNDLGERVRGLVSASWSLGRDDKGRKSLRLAFKDHFGEAEDEFAPGELDDLNHFGARAYRLWGILLRGETQQHLSDLHEIVKGWGGEVGQD